MSGPATPTSTFDVHSVTETAFIPEKFDRENITASDHLVRNYLVNGYEIVVAKFSPEVEKGLKEGGGEQWKIWLHMIQQQAAAILGTKDIKYVNFSIRNIGIFVTSKLNKREVLC